jgi:hypothetical protein
MIDQAVAVILGSVLDLAEGTPTARSTALLTLTAAVVVSLTKGTLMGRNTRPAGRHVPGGQPHQPQDSTMPGAHPDRVRSTDPRDVSGDSDRNTWHQTVKDNR